MLQSFSENCLRPVAVALALGATLASAGPAEAIVCKATATIVFARGADQAIARTLALQNWSARVRRTHGPAWSDWKAAASRNVECSHPSDWICYASGRPCS
jgi:hypothetical protein